MTCNRFATLFKACTVGLSLLAGATSVNAFAQDMGHYAAVPRTVESGVAPLVMLALSNDHQLYFKAYTDYDDLNNDRSLDSTEITYFNGRDYAGYFSPNHCYTYANNVFSISSTATTHYCSGATEWSGNFLNWATMTRIDLLRSTLYGGKRFTDTDSSTVLERSYLPNDAHSFAKFYNGADLDQLTPSSSAAGLTICNTTLHTGGGAQTRSKDNTNPPLMRVIEGNYGLWASSERYQCLLRGGVDEGLGDSADRGRANANASLDASVQSAFNGASGGSFTPALQSPHVNDRDNTALERDYVVRVVACPNSYLSELEGCKGYGETNTVYKPVGILQSTGESQEVLYGLITGSYNNNKNGGYLRKNISNFGAEIDGDTGVFLPNVNGIVSNLDAFRIAGWQENDGGAYNDPNNAYDNIGYNEAGGAAAENSGNDDEFCRWSQLEFGNGHCVDWGNPLGEILAESYRYFAGLAGEVNTQTTAGAEGNKAPTGVTLDAWAPLNDDRSEWACANMNVIGLNTSAQTFDREVDTFAAGISGAGDIDDATDSLLPANNAFFVASTSDVGADMQALLNCNPKVVGALSDATGVCPDAPGQEGTWTAAGLAKIVAGRKEIDIEQDNPASYDLKYDINALLLGNQRVVTHGLQLATPLPLAKIKLSDERNIVITPACENWGNYDQNREFLGQCALVDFRVLSLSDDSLSGAFYVNWEDSAQGGDFDQDMHGILSYELSADKTTLTVTTRVIGQSTNARLGFGYTLGGVGNGYDRSHFHSGVNGYPGVAPYRYDECNLNMNATIYQVYQNGVVQENVQGCGSNQGASTGTYALSADGSPASILNPVLELAAEGAGGKYVSVTDPTLLKSQLEAIIGDIGPTPIAGGGEVAASANGAGSKLYLHTTYFAQKENASGDRVNWVSQVGALFIDDEGRLREDTASEAESSIDGELDPNDLIIRFLPRVEGEAEPRVEKYSGETKIEGTFTFDDIAYIWHTSDSFAAPGSREIHTVIPANLAEDVLLDTDIVTGNLVEFGAAFDTSPSGTLSRKLLGNSVPAADLVSFVKGSNPGNAYRSRTLDGTTYLLGDVLTSPVIQGRPDYTYARELNDEDYIKYQNRYKNDAKIAYVAANDGLIHAFYADAPTDATYAANYTGKTVGQELWAYAPFNLLPHLQWLASPRYVHVPYFDGFMRTFDVKAFADDGENGTYPGGWGTILVVGTGRGGGAFDVDLGGEATTELTTRPAYIILDITERGAPPKLIAEISHDELGFTTGEPDIARFKDAAGNTKWYLVFGSGPRGTTSESSRVAQQNYEVAGVLDTTPASFLKPSIFAFDIESKTLTQTSVTGAADGAFIGGINSMDWNRDFVDDALYFGTVAGGQDAPTGQLFRAYIAAAGNSLSVTPEVMIDLGKPVANRPLTVIDYRNNYWVFTGTGRFYVRSDGVDDSSDNVYVGLKERQDYSPDATSVITGGRFYLTDLFDTTNVTINNQGDIGNAVGKGEGTPTLSDINALRTELSRKEANEDGGPPADAWGGWYFRFSENERQHTGTGYLASTLFFSTTVPGSAQQCSAGDKGYIYVMDMRSGVFSPYYQGATVNGVKSKKEVDGIGPELNSPADVMNLSDGSVGEPERLEFEGDSQRHSWREISIPW